MEKLYTKTIISEKLKKVIQKIKDTLIEYKHEEFSFKYEYNESNYKLICNIKEGKYRLLKYNGIREDHFLLYKDENKVLTTNCDKETINLCDIISVLINYQDILQNLKYLTKQIDDLLDDINNDSLFEK